MTAMHRQKAVVRRQPDITLTLSPTELVEVIKSHHRYIGNWLDSLPPHIDETLVGVLESDAMRLVELISSLRRADEKA